jgi:LmbE family N-acetylglucosaminyl deacetylase
MIRRAFAIAAHPDDIEFMMAGTLILLARADYEIHYMAIANGSCGTSEHMRQEIIRVRRKEARAAASSIGAVYHESLVDDIAIFYKESLLARVSAIVREVAPEILLVHAPSDYMEDHQNAARLAVTAAFTRNMPNFPTHPPRAPVDRPVTVYHAQPHSNRDPLGQLVWPGMFVDISSVIEEKRAMLAHHQSQRKWLDKTQGMGAYLSVMEENAEELGVMSGLFAYAEGWRRRFHAGLCAASADPIADALGEQVCYPAQQ